MQECAKICVKKCKRAKNWKIDFADVCIFFFWRQSYLQIFAYFTSPPPSLGVTLVTLKQRRLYWLSATYICRFYILRRKVDFAWESDKLFTINKTTAYALRTSQMTWRAASFNLQWCPPATRTVAVREWCHPNLAWWTYLRPSSWWSWWCCCRCDKHSCP